jgi:hypothetical protein
MRTKLAQVRTAGHGSALKGDMRRPGRPLCPGGDSLDADASPGLETHQLYKPRPQARNRPMAWTIHVMKKIS